MPGLRARLRGDAARAGRATFSPVSMVERIRSAAVRVAELVTARRSVAQVARRDFDAIAAVADGARVRVRGRVSAEGETLIAPLSGRRCVYWCLSIEESSFLAAARTQAQGLVRNATPPHLPAWSARTREESVVGFAIEDATGRATIDVRELSAFATADHVRLAPRIRPFDVRTADIIERYTATAAPLRRHAGRLRVREAVFAVGAELIVLGRARWIEETCSSDRTYRESARTRRLVIEPDEDDAVCASDDLDGPY
jgi:hypothetical protein